MNYKILVVDDEPANIRMLERLFRGHFEVVCAASGSEALELLTLHNVALIISDQRMPGMTGIEFLIRAAEMRPQCVRIILTGFTDVNDLVEALNSGVIYKFVTKPWVNADLLQTVKRGLSHYETIRAQHQLNLENQRLRDRLENAEKSIYRMLKELLSQRDVTWVERAALTRDTAEKIGSALEFDRPALKRLSVASYLHEIANIRVPGHLLSRGPALSDEEASVVREYREKSLELLDALSTFDDVATAIRHQTEAFDGTGLPKGLAGAQIPLESRIIAVADAYAKMSLRGGATMNGSTDEEAIKALQSAAGRSFDPHVVNVFCGLISASQVRPTLSGDPLYVNP